MIEGMLPEPDEEKADAIRSEMMDYIGGTIQARELVLLPLKTQMVIP